MTPAKFAFYLKPDDTHWYYINGAGGVAITATETAIADVPRNWNSIQKKWPRDEAYMALFLSMSTAFEFIGDGAKILSHVWCNEGIEGVCQIVIKVREDYDIATGWTYKLFYPGTINFFTYAEVRDFVKANIAEGGVVAKLKANESVPYQIPIDDSDCIWVNLDGVRLRNTSTLRLANDPTVGNTAHQMLPVISVITNESDIQVDVIEQPTQQVLGSNLIISSFPFFAATISGTVVIDYDIHITVGNPGSFSLGPFSYYMIIYRRTPAGVLTPYIIYNNSNPAVYVGNNNAVGSVSIPVSAGDTLVYFSGIFPFDGSSGTGAPVVTHTYSFSTLAVAYDLKLPQTVAKAYRPFQVFDKLMAQITGGAGNAASQFLTDTITRYYGSSPYRRVYTCGDALRNLNKDTAGNASTPALTIKLTDFFKDLNACYLNGLSLNNSGKIEIEHLSRYFDATTLIADLGEVANLSVQPASSLFFNQINIGYNKFTYDALNGRDEPNTTATYKMPIVSMSGTKDWVSPYRADFYGIEYTRANLSGKKTTDAESDNDIFVIEIADTTTSLQKPNATAGTMVSAYSLYRPQNSGGHSATGLIAADTAYNLTLMPVLNLLRKGAWLRSIGEKLDTKSITFQIINKNASVSVSLGFGTIASNGNIVISTLDAPLVLPRQVSFDVEGDEALAAQIAAQPKGYFKGTWNGTEYRIFPMDCGVNNGRNARYTFIGLMLPDMVTANLERPL